MEEMKMIKMELIKNTLEFIKDSNKRWLAVNPTKKIRIQIINKKLVEVLNSFESENNLNRDKVIELLLVTAITEIERSED